MRKIMHRLYAKFICFFESHALTVLCMGLVQTAKSPKGLYEGAQPQREILITRGTSLGNIFQTIPKDFPLFFSSKTWNRLVKILRPRVALGLTLNIFGIYLRHV